MTVDCRADYECVVVYRAYGNSTLNLLYGNTVSKTVTLETGNYTFAIFRRTSESDIDERPFISRMIVIEDTEPSSSSPPSPPSGTGKFESQAIHTKAERCMFSIDQPGTSSDGTGVVVGVVLFVVIILSVGVVATVFIVWRKRKVVMLSNVTHKM